MTVPALTIPGMTGTGSGLGASATRPDASLKVTGQFAYSSDLWMPGMLWGVTVRSPHPHARIRAVDITAALNTPGVHAVLTHEDVPGCKYFGLFRADQQVLAIDRVVYQGEPVALVAADHPEIARRAAALISIDYQQVPAVLDPRTALDPDVAQLHPGGNCVRRLVVRHGNPDAAAPVVVRGQYTVGMQDQAFLGPESGLAVPDHDGGVELYVASQGLHDDLRQIAPCLGLPAEQVRMTLAGVGGAFGGREDVSMHIHACLLALHTLRPVKMVYRRDESFFGHVHRHPAHLSYEHGVGDDGRLIYVRAEIVLDGGAYASSSKSVVANCATMGAGPYQVLNLKIDARAVYTNNPPCGAMRGFGAVQAGFAYESQMDRCASRLGMDPVEFRILNAIGQGDRMPTGQLVDSPAPVAELLRRVQGLPAPTDENPPAAERGIPVLTALPGGVGNTTHGEGVVRGVGYAVGVKNACFSEGADDPSTATVRFDAVGDELVATVHTAAAEVGQGLVTIQQQIVRSELGVARVVVLPADTTIAGAGSTSASRQTYVTGGAVKKAAESVRQILLQRAARRLGRPRDRLRLDGGKIVDQAGTVLDAALEYVRDDPIEQTATYRHRPTQPLDPETGQGNAHVQYTFAAHRAVVDVDVELGLVKVVELACAQDVGVALNPQAVEGQIHGGSAQGLGLALMEEIQIEHGSIRNASFTDYLIPTILDVPPMPTEILEYADPNAPYGVRGVGEAPTISSTPAIVAAIRAATGKTITRVPVRPIDLID